VFGRKVKEVEIKCIFKLFKLKKKRIENKNNRNYYYLFV